MATTHAIQASPSNANRNGQHAAEQALTAIATELRRIADTLERTPAEAAPEETAPQDEAAFQALRQWRADEARKQAMPPYIIATDRVLRAVAAAKPDNVEALRGVPGLGPVKVEKYGAAMVQVLGQAS